MLPFQWNSSREKTHKLAFATRPVYVIVILPCQICTKIKFQTVSILIALIIKVRHCGQLPSTCIVQQLDVDIDIAIFRKYRIKIEKVIWKHH